MRIKYLILAVISVGVMFWASVSDAQCVVDTSTPTYANGKFLRYTPCNANGELKTTVTGGGGGGAVTVADGADASLGATTDAACGVDANCTLQARTRKLISQLDSIQTSVQLLDDAIHASDAALSKVLAQGCQFDDTAPGTTTEDSVKAVRCSTRREIYNQIRDAAGNERGANVNASNELQVQLGTPAAMADAESNPTLPKIAVYNKIWNGSTWDRATKADVGAGAAGSNTQRVLLATDQTVSDPCMFRAKTVVPINISTATTTQLVAASASNKLYVCSIHMVTDAANDVALVEDDTSACASPTAGMAGGTTAATGYNWTAGAGMTLGNGSGTVMVSAATNRYVCIITSAVTQLSGALSIVLAP